MAFNKNELILDRVRFLTTHNLDTDELIFRLTQLEEPSLNCTAEGEEVTDAVGALITTLYRSKRAEFTATNSLLSLDLAAAQFGTKKVVASSDDMIVDYMSETITIADGATTINLKHTPVAGSVGYIYSLASGEIATAYKAGATASATDFVVAADGTITLPVVDGTDDQGKAIKVPITGKVFVEYQYKTASAVKIRNLATEYPESCRVIVYVYFRDVCNDKLYSGKIIFPKAKLNPESVELALTSTGKHAFAFQAFKDYCAEDEDAELFSIIVAE